MQLARELARKITRKNDLNDEEVLDVVMGLISDLKRVVIDAWNHIKEAVNEFIELIHETETEKKHAYNWHVPLKMEAPPMPDFELPKHILARSHI